MHYEEIRSFSIDDYVRRYGADSSSAAFLFFLFRDSGVEADFELSWGWLTAHGDCAEYEPHSVEIWILSARWLLAFVPDFLGRAALLPVCDGRIDEAIRNWLTTLPKPSVQAEVVIDLVREEF